MADLNKVMNASVPKVMINPLIILNMGAEMIYILQQRLKAQKISSGKACRVLSDTVGALFDVAMIDTIFKPNTTYESSTVRTLFHQITHSSIMRLNDQSMDKLYDLMLMGLKVQLIRSRDCYELIESTLNHIDNIYSIIHDKCCKHDKNSDHSNLLSMIQGVRERIIRTYLILISLPKLLVIRKCLFQWLQDRRIKVSILLQKNMQSLDGHIITQTEGILPKYTEIPGKQYRITLQNTVKLNQNTLKLPNSNGCNPNHIKYTFQFGKLHTNIGENLYQSNSSKSDSNRKKGNNATASSVSPNKQTTQNRVEISNAVKNQLNDLAGIINYAHSDTQRKKIVNPQDIIKLDLFDLDFVDTKDGDTASGNKPEIRFGRTTSGLKDAMNALDLGDDDVNDSKDANHKTEEEDLFDLLNDGDDQQLYLLD